ncbi:MAG: glycosyltransferase family 4 protein [Planctomycetes bacterium]|nr:glycosyltransferase family 4 protein [Planctomycetota bacterium]
MNDVLDVAISLLCGTTGGPATYGRRLAAALGRRSDVRTTVLTDRPELVDAPGVATMDVPMRGGLDRLRWQHLALPRAMRSVRPSVYHDTKNALPFGLRIPAVVTVHDLAYHTVPATFGFASRTFLRAATAHAVKRARAIVVPSEATARDLRSIHPHCAERIHVVPHGIDPARDVPADRRDEVRRRLVLPQRFVLHTGTIQARKNVDLVIAGVREVRRRGLPHRAVVVGRRGWLADAAMREIERDDTALWIPHANDDDLAAIYAMADAFVSPSAYEGFGFAVADALAAGVPTIVANNSSLPELCGDGAILLPSLDAQAVAAALEKVLLDDAVGARLRRAGPARAAQFTWEKAAAGHVLAYYDAVAGGLPRTTPNA